MKQKVIRAGTHSLAVIVPSEFVHSLGIKHGDTVVIKTDKAKGTIEMQFSGVMQLSLADGVKKRKKNK